MTTEHNAGPLHYPEALRLADALDVDEISYTEMCKAADELRRLHSVNAELLEALRNLARMAEALKEPCSADDPESCQAIRNGKYMNISYAARAAIARAEEVKR